MSAEELLQKLKVEINETSEEINDLVRAGSETWRRRHVALNKDPSLYNYLIQIPDWSIVIGTVDSIDSDESVKTKEVILELYDHLNGFRSTLQSLKRQLVPEPITIVFDEDDRYNYQFFDLASNTIVLQDWNTSSVEGYFCNPPEPFFHQRSNI